MVEQNNITKIQVRIKILLIVQKQKKSGPEDCFFPGRRAGSHCDISCLLYHIPRTKYAYTRHAFLCNAITEDNRWNVQASKHEILLRGIAYHVYIRTYLVPSTYYGRRLETMAWPWGLTCWGRALTKSYVNKEWGKQTRRLRKSCRFHFFCSDKKRGSKWKVFAKAETSPNWPKTGETAVRLRAAIPNVVRTYSYPCTRYFSWWGIIDHVGSTPPKDTNIYHRRKRYQHTTRGQQRAVLARTAAAVPAPAPAPGQIPGNGPAGEPVRPQPTHPGGSEKSAYV